MRKLAFKFAACVFFIGIASAHAQSTVQSSGNGGTLVVVPGAGEVKRPNDEARVTLMVEEQDKDKALAASRANQRMKQGMETLKREDPDAILKTRGYYSYPVYPDEPPRPGGRPYVKSGQPTSWRVGQFVDVTTKNLIGLPKTVAAAQAVLALNSLHFGLSEEVMKDLDKKGIEVAYRNLTERVATIAKAMGRNPAEAMYENIDFEGLSPRVPQAQTYAAKAMAVGSTDAQVAEPSFEPGETVLTTRVVGKVRFK